MREYVLRCAGFVAADDIVSETYTTVWTRWADLPDDLSARTGWVFGVARNKIREHERSSRRRIGLAVKASAQGRTAGADDDISAELAALEHARHLLDRLPPAERDAVSLTVIVGLTPTEAATVLGCTPTAVTSRVHRGRLQLRRLVEEESDDA